MGNEAVVLVLFLLQVTQGLTEFLETLQKCPGNDFNCTNGRCVLASWKCDGRNDCGDNSDEIGCPYLNTCTPKQFACLNGECIAKLWRCDGERDCDDGSDERDCGLTTCDAMAELRCGNGQCIPVKWICDGLSDCLDGADERNCTSCGSGKFKCQDGLCIDHKKLCDSKKDCQDGSDEMNCSIADECDTPGRCSHFCNDTKDGLKCSCAEGYLLNTDQTTCKAVGDEAYLSYMTTDRIAAIGPVPTFYHLLDYSISRNFESVIGMDYDAAERTYLWTERKEKAINSFDVDSEAFTVLFKTEYEPVYLRRDWITKNLYYTTEEGSIECCNGNGSYCTNVVTNIPSQISGFSISPKYAFLFWGVSRQQHPDPGPGLIERAGLDGTFRVAIISQHIFSPTAITVDPVLKTVYWFDPLIGGIESADFNGLRRRSIVDHLRYPVGLAVFEDYIYWSAIDSNHLTRCNKFNCTHQQQFYKEGSLKTFMVVVHKAAQMKGVNRCADNNCLHLCLPTRTSFVCKYDDRYSSDLTNSGRGSSPGNQSCPENHCLQNAECVVEEHRYVCRCPLHFTGERCEGNLGQMNNSSNELHPLWLVCPILIVICICLISTIVFFYQRHRRKTTAGSSSVQFVSTRSCEKYYATS